MQINGGLGAPQLPEFVECESARTVDEAGDFESPRIGNFARRRFPDLRPLVTSGELLAGRERW